MTLVIEPGVEVRFNSGVGLTVNGTLRAIGSEAAPITFTANSAAPTRGFWSSITFGAASTGSRLEFTRVAYGGAGGYGNIRLSGAPLALVDSIVEQSSSSGLYGADLGVVSILRSTFLTNAGSALAFSLGPSRSFSPTFTGLSAGGNGINGIEISGQIVGSATLPSNPGLAYVSRDLFVPASAALTIEAGAVIKLFQTSDTIVVDGRLTAAGSSLAPVVFTSIKDDSAGGDTNGDGAASSPAPGDWATIFITGGSITALEHAELRYGGSGDTGRNCANTGTRYAWANITSCGDFSGQLTARDSRFVGGGRYGLDVERGTVVIERSRFEEAVLEGVLLSYPRSLTIADSHFATAGRAAVYLIFGEVAPQLTLSGISAAGNLYNGIQLNGSVSGNTDLPGSPGIAYVLGSVHIPFGAALTIEAGAVIKPLERSSTMIVDGLLLAEGAAGSPIVFTSLKDDSAGGDTNGDGAASSPAPGDWGTIFITGNSITFLKHSELRYGGSGNTGRNCANTGTRYAWANITSCGDFSGQLTARDSRFVGGGRYGLDVERGTVVIERSRFEGAVLEGVLLSYPRSLTIVDSSFGTAGRAAAYLLLGEAASQLTLSGISAAGNLRNGIQLAGDIAGATTLPADPGLPYLIDNLRVGPTAELTIESNVVVKFIDDRSELTVDGRLVAQGNPLAPVVFTSLKDDLRGGDTNGDGAASSPAPGDWGSIFVKGTSVSSLQNTILSYGGSGRSGLNCANTGARYTLGNIATCGDFAGNLSVSNSLIQNSGRYGLYLFVKATGSATVLNSTITANTSDGVLVSYGSAGPVTVNNSSFISNGGEGVYNASDLMVVNAEYNWWGDAGGPTPFGDGINDSARVDAVPFRTTPE